VIKLVCVFWTEALRLIPSLIVAVLATWLMQPKIRRESRGGRPAALNDGVLWRHSRQLDDDEGRGGGAPADGRRLLGDGGGHLIPTTIAYWQWLPCQLACLDERFSFLFDMLGREISLFFSLRFSFSFSFFTVAGVLTANSSIEELRGAVLKGSRW